MILEQLLVELGLSLGASGIYDLLRSYFMQHKDVNVAEVKKELASCLDIQNASIAADKIINFLANNGDIEIGGSKIFARKAILYSSNKRTKFSLEDSKSETDKTKIDVGRRAKIEGQGGAGVRQDEDGISFCT